MMWRQTLVAVLLALTTSIIVTAAVLAHPAEEHEASSFNTIWLLIPAGISLLVGAYLMYRVIKLRRSA